MSPRQSAYRPSGRQGRARTEHFEIGPRRSAPASGADDLGATDEPSLAQDPRGLLHLAVPKRLLKRAVDRNAVRRVAREAWLARWRASSAKQLTMQGSPRVGPSLLRLTRRPQQWAELSRPARKRLWRVEIDRLLLQLFSA